MMKKEKTAALLLGITMSLTGTALAAPADTAQDIDSRIAALEQQQSNLEKEIKELRHQNSQLKNQERSQKKQLNGLSKSVKNELDRVQISGFGASAGITTTSRATRPQRQPPLLPRPQGQVQGQ